VDEIYDLLDKVEKLLGEDDDIYCELAYDVQSISDSINSTKRKLKEVLADKI
jgi:hypothetical protein